MRPISVSNFSKRLKDRFQFQLTIQPHFLFLKILVLFKIYRLLTSQKVSGEVIVNKWGFEKRNIEPKPTLKRI